MDFNNLPKLLCEQVTINGENKFGIFLGMRGGTSVMAYVLPPQLAKGMLDNLKTQVEKYESLYGEIDMSGVESGIQSPIQR